MTRGVWNGQKIAARVRAAQTWGIDKVMSECVIGAKSNHPGWKNVTSFAEGSIRVVSFAQPSPAGGFSGWWGSAECNYMIWLELCHGSALRNAADVYYPTLGPRVQEAYTRGS